MTDDKNKDEGQARSQAKPQASGAAPKGAEHPDKPAIEKLKLVTTEEERLAAEIEKLRR